MPLIHVTLVEGRDPAQIRALVSGVTEAVERSLGAPRDAVRVIVQEVPGTHWAVGGVTLEERRRADGADR